MASRIIESKTNSFFKKIKKLQKRKYREQDKLFIAEGRKFLQFSYRPKYIICAEGYDKELLVKEGEIVYTFSKTLFKEISSQENSQGVILVYEYPKLIEEKLSDDLVILDQIQDPGNLGTIIRLLDAVGLKDIILVKGTVDVYNEKTVRSSMGSIFNMNYHYMDYDELFPFLETQNYNIISTALAEDSVDYTQMTIKEKNAIIFGNEGNGISKELLQKSDEKIIIPIYGSAESLNVGVATGIVMYKYIELKRK